MFDNEEHDGGGAVLPAHPATPLKRRFGRERSCFLPMPNHGPKSTTAGWVLFYKTGSKSKQLGRNVGRKPEESPVGWGALWWSGEFRLY